MSRSVHSVTLVPSRGLNVGLLLVAGSGLVVVYDSLYLLTADKLLTSTVGSVVLDREKDKEEDDDRNAKVGHKASKEPPAISSIKILSSNVVVAVLDTMPINLEHPVTDELDEEA